MKWKIKIPQSVMSPMEFRHTQQALTGRLSEAWKELIVDHAELLQRTGGTPQAVLAELVSLPETTQTITALRMLRAVINNSHQITDFSPLQLRQLIEHTHRWVSRDVLTTLPWDFAVVLCDKLIYALLGYESERIDADWELAEFCGRLALSLMEKNAPDDPHLSDAIDMLGTVLLNRRNTNRPPRLREAETLFLRNLDLAPRWQAVHPLKRALLNLGILNEELSRQEPGRLLQGIEYFDQLEELNQRGAPDTHHLLLMLTNRGWARCQLPRDRQPAGFHGAVSDLSRAVELLKTDRSKQDQLAYALMHLGLAQWELSEYSPELKGPALGSYAEAEELFRRLGNRDGLSRVRHNRGLLFRSAGESHRALAEYSESLKFREGHAIEEWETLGNIVDIRVDPQMPPFGPEDGDVELLERFQELSQQLSTHGDPDRALWAYYYGARLLWHAGPSTQRDSGLIRWLERAIAHAESVWKATAAEPMVRYHLGRWLGTFYAARMLIGIRRRENVDALLRFAQNGKARTLILERQGESATPPLMVDSAALLRRLQQTPGTAFIEIGVSSLGTAVLVASVNRGGALDVQTLVLDVREEELVGLLGKPGKGWQWHIEALRNADDASQLDKLEACAAGMEHILRILYERLLGPVIAGLRSQGVQDLVFAVHGPLAAFPLAAAWRLVDGEPRYLIEDFRSISLTPSVTSFVYAEQTRPLTACLYIVGDTRTLPKEAGRDGLHLESIWRRSAQAVPSLKSPSPEEFLRSLEQADLVHAVCHGEFDPWRLDKSGIQVGGDALLSCERLLTDPNPKRTAMVVLCACRSGRSRSEDFGADWLGLSGVLLRRGVQSVLAALWDVDYAASFRMSCAFYEHLFGSNQPAAIAASLAMRDILQAGRAAKRGDAVHWFLDGREAKIIPRLRRLLDSPWLWACMQFVDVTCRALSQAPPERTG